MKTYKTAVAVRFLSTLWMIDLASAAGGWQEANFPPPNAGHLVFTITSDGNPACASYDGRSCLWGKSMAEIDFSKVRPLVCGAAHRNLYGVTGFEDPRHWCNLALHTPATQSATPTPTPPQPPAGGYRSTEWSGWGSAAGVQYRYRVGWDPATGGSGKMVDAIYEVRNPSGQPWSGAARSLDCTQGTLWGSTDVTIGPGQTKEVRVHGPNCGNASNPNIRANVVRAGKFD